MALWKLHGNGKSIAPGEVVAPDERLGWGRTISMGMQHVVAMFGATFLVPLITGFPPSTTLFFSGIGTIFFLLITGNKLPSYLGSSFAFLAPIAAVAPHNTGEAPSLENMGVALFGVMVAGITLAIVGAIVHFAGSKWIDKLMPPPMTGAIVMIIGFNLAGAAKNNFQYQYVADSAGCAADPANTAACAVTGTADLTGWITIFAIVLITVLFRGIIGRLSILLGVLVGYVAAVFQGQVSFAAIEGADWFGLPEYHTPVANPVVFGLFVPVVLVLIAENVGHVKSVALMTGKNYDKQMGRALLADGVATTVAGIGGGSGTTTYAENIGVMAATKVYSTALYWVAGITALLLSLIPKFGQAINTVPTGVIGGAGVVLYGMIGLLGARIWVENKVDFTSPVNLFPAAVGLIMGISDLSITIDGNTVAGGVAVGTVTALVLYHIMKPLAKWRKTAQA
ncbi:MAG: NCS2 family nucleobase:cation symporter [Propionibacteriaceae bacterium]|jgi:uracil-xanthine permease|nr:NCS2 family nucleobase:cation symporter [Propionibacteriaceae bacterium]